MTIMERLALLVFPYYIACMGHRKQQPIFASMGAKEMKTGNPCQVHLVIRPAVTKAVIDRGVGQELLWAEDEEPKVVVTGVCRYIKRHPGVAVSSVEVAISGPEMGGEMTQAFMRIHRALRRRRAA